MKAQKPRISFRVFGDSGPLSAHFQEGPYGDAVNALTGDGVGWFSPGHKELLGVEFDDVDQESDYQVLKFKDGLEVEVEVRDGEATVKVALPKKQKTT